jgi:hypothetical protein
MKSIIRISTLAASLILGIALFWFFTTPAPRSVAFQKETDSTRTPIAASTHSAKTQPKNGSKQNHQQAPPPIPDQKPKSETLSEPFEKEDSFLSGVHDKVDAVAAIHEKMQQIPGAVIPELSMLEPVDWVRLGEKFPKLSDPHQALEAIAETRVQAKGKFLSALNHAHGVFYIEKSLSSLTSIYQLKAKTPQQIPDAIWDRYEIPERAEWTAISEKWVPNRQCGPPELIIREKQTDWSGPDGQAIVIFFKEKQAEINGLNIQPLAPPKTP